MAYGFRLFQYLWLDDDYLLALKLQEEYDEQTKERNTQSETIWEPDGLFLK
jgi:hypothetical protein